MKLTVDQAIDKANWIEAKTFKNFAPHQYIRSWQEPEAFDVLSECINKHGVEKEWRYGKKYKYYFHGEHKYWMLPTGDTDPPTIILNRTGKDNN